MNSASLLIQREWEAVGVSNPKYQRMLKRRSKILRDVPSYLHHINTLESLLRSSASKDDRVLDVACGFGFQLVELSSRGWKRLWGLEIDPNLSSLMLEAAGRFGLAVRGQIGDACSIPFVDNSFDVVTCKNFFEHVYDFDLALKEQMRVLRRGGRLIILDGNFRNPKTLFDLVLAYPIRSRGRLGGAKWLLTKGKVQKNLYGYLPLGKDEDVHSPAWWSKRLRHVPGLKIVDSMTTGAVSRPNLPRQITQFIGGCVIIAEKN